MVEVVAALIWENDTFMICKRPAHKARGLLWEFVGGKVEPGETHAEALIRECREELAVTVKVGTVFCEVTHTYPAEIPQYDFCPADKEILELIMKEAKA